MPEVTDAFANPTIVLTDEAGRTLPCFVEQTLEVGGQAYLLLLPVDHPIEIFSWQTDEDDDEVLADVEDDCIDDLFATAKAVLAELDLTLQRSAFTLSAAGELPEVEDEDCFTLELGDTEAAEPTADEFQMLATFFHNDEQYTLCTPLDPLLFFARREPSGTITLLSPEEFQRLQPQLEDQLFDVLE
jgi:hypothetical protein